MCRPPSRPPTPGPLMCLPMPLCATPAEVPSKILRLRRAWQCAMVVVVDVSWRRAADVTTHLHQQLFPSPAAPEDRCLSAPMRNGTLSEGGLATACVTVTRGLLGVSLPAAPLPRCYSPAHIRPPACLSMSLCASPLRSLRILRLRRANGTWWPMWCHGASGCGLAATLRLSHHWLLHTIPPHCPRPRAWSLLGARAPASPPAYVCGRCGSPLFF